MTDGQASPVLLRPFHVGVDWLTFHGRGPVTAFESVADVDWRGPNGEDWRFIKQDGKSGRHPIYDAVWYLMCPREGKLLTVCMKPARGVHAKGHPDLMHWQFHNRLLASNRWQPILTQMLEMGFAVEGLSRLDIAFDGLREEFDPTAVVDKGLRGIDGMDYYGRSTWSPRMEGRAVAGFTMGSRSGNKYLRVYNKSRELKSAMGSGKRKYFEQVWGRRIGHAAATAEGLEVMRFEMQLKGKELTRYMGDVPADYMIDVLSNDAGLVTMLNSTARTVFDFRYSKEGGRARDARPAVVWDYSRITDCVDTWDRAPRTITISENALKVAARVLWMLGSTKLAPELINDARLVSNFGGLSNWFNDAEGRWAKEWARLIDRGGERIDRMVERSRGIPRRIDGGPME